MAGRGRTTTTKTTTTTQLKRVSPGGVQSDLAKLCCLSATASHTGQPGQTLSSPRTGTADRCGGVEAWIFLISDLQPRGPFSLTIEPSPIVWQSDVDLVCHGGVTTALLKSRSFLLLIFLFFLV